MSAQPRRLPRYIFRALAVGAVLVVGGLISLWAGAVQTRDSTASTILLNIGVTLITIGLVGVIYDSLLRQEFVADVLGTKEVADARINRVGNVESMPVPTSALRGKRVTVVAPHLSQWLQHSDWVAIVETARATNCLVAIYTGPLEAAEGADIRLRLKQDWDQIVDGHSASQRSAVAIYTHPIQRPIYYLCIAGDEAWFGVDHPYGEYHPGRSLGLQFSRSTTKLWNWAATAESNFANCSRIAANGPEDKLRDLESSRPVPTEQKGWLQ